jgi:hypothetical protein
VSEGRSHDNDAVTRRIPGPLAVWTLLLAVSLLACDRRTGHPVDPSSPTANAPASPESSPVAPPSPTVSGPTEPQDEPIPPPSPDCIHASDHGVASVSLAIYFLECGGQRIPGSQDLTTVPVGCRIHFNATPRDGIGAPTCSRTWPVWQVGPEELITGGGGDTFTPAYTAQRSGRISARCIVDGVRSAWLILDLVER